MAYMSTDYNIPKFNAPKHDHQAWWTWLHCIFPFGNKKERKFKVVDLFSGCGGLALGFEAAGFDVVGYEMKPSAVATHNKNLVGPCEEVVLKVGTPERKEVDVLIGGPPCQPFSTVGRQTGIKDARNGFPIFLDAVRRMSPKLALIENVRGLSSRNKEYLALIKSELKSCGYAVEAKILNAAAFGVPQNRERLVIVGSKTGWEWPEPLTESPVSTGTALGPLVYETREESEFLTPAMDAYIAEYERKSCCRNPRDLHLDRPSRTVTCRNLGGATSDMLRIRLADGRRRMLHVREGARLQGFPDWFEFTGSCYEQFEQIGNAVPPLLAYSLAIQTMKVLERKRTKVLTQRTRIPLKIAMSPFR